jgi:sec-independent protein translocase protein TatB
MNIFSNIGITELILILLLALLVVGPERLPEVARQLAKVLRDVRTAYENLTRDLGPELMSIQESTREIRESVESVRRIPKDTIDSVVKAAELDETVKELRQVEDQVRQVGKTVSDAQRMVRQPLKTVAEVAAGTAGAASGSGEEDAQREDALPAPESAAVAPAPVDETAVAGEETEAGAGAGEEAGEVSPPVPAPTLAEGEAASRSDPADDKGVEEEIDG